MIKYDQSLATNYNAFHALPEHLFDLQLSKIRQYLQIKPTDVVLDVGCGAGRLAIPLSQYCHIVGIEKSKEMAEQITQSEFLRVFNEGFIEFLRRPVSEEIAPSKAYFSFSLHQIGISKYHQLCLIEKTLDILPKDGKVLLITVTQDQFSEITVNRLFPSVSEIDTERYLQTYTLRSLFNVEVVTQDTFYSNISKNLLAEMLRSKYISTLQLISEEELDRGIEKVLTHPGTSYPYADCYTYIALTKK